ncbi:unnamed protein product [Effrenium voratum]|nr:unnamed protein product [Effrenium voratum]
MHVTQPLGILALGRRQALASSALARRQDENGWFASLKLEQAPFQVNLAHVRLQKALQVVQDVAAVFRSGIQTSGSPVAWPDEPSAEKKPSSGMAGWVHQLELDLDVAAPVIHWHCTSGVLNIRFGRVHLRTAPAGPGFLTDAIWSPPETAAPAELSRFAAVCLFEDAGIAVESQDVLVIGKVTLRVQREAIWRLSLRGGGIDCVLHPDLTRLVMQLAEGAANKSRGRLVY